MIKPDLELTYGDRSLLASVHAMPGWKLVNDIMRAEADKFIVALINAPGDDDAEVLARHKLAKAAAQFYIAVINRINNEVEAYVAAPRSSDKPADMTEGLIDLGDFETQLHEVPNLLGGGEDFDELNIR